MLLRSLLILSVDQVANINVLAYMLRDNDSKTVTKFQKYFHHIDFEPNIQAQVDFFLINSFIVNKTYGKQELDEFEREVFISDFPMKEQLLRISTYDVETQKISLSENLANNIHDCVEPFIFLRAPHLHQQMQQELQFMR